MICHPRAAYKLECSYDGRIPPDELQAAREIDAAFERELPDHDGKASRKVAQFKRELKEVIAKIRASGPGHVVTSRERYMLCEVVELIRYYRRQLHAASACRGAA